MPDNSQTNQVTPPTPAEAAPEAPDASTIMSDVANKIGEAHDILIALSSDPSVDEMAAAIGLSLFLDRLNKRATAIYSGNTPNALEFLKPEETFESDADALQDFVIALNKDKADHLRYKLDGDYVKIFVTPYRSRIDEEDLEFSYGDYNIDLVLALNVSNGVDLDSALREHGRIMHDATIVNITTGNPGKFGEIEWSDKTSSSLSEMIATLLYGMSSGKAKIESEDATAFLTGIVAATDRFSKGNTTSETMRIASKLMESGADQQLISQNITADIDNQLFSFTNFSSDEENEDATSLDIDHTEEEPTEETTEEKTESAESAESKAAPESNEEDNSLASDLEAAKAGLMNAGAEAVPTPVSQPVDLNNPASSAAPTYQDYTVPSVPVQDFSAPVESTEPVLPPVPPMAPTTSTITPAEEPVTAMRGEKVITPSEDFSAESEGSSKYGQMLEAALAEGATSEPTSIEPPIITSEPDNLAASAVPQVENLPDVNGTPELNYLPFPDEQVLPPPPTPPISFDGSMPTPPVTPPVSEPTMPPVAPIMPPTEAPVETPVEAPAAPAPTDPGAFKIPGM